MSKCKYCKQEHKNGNTGYKINYPKIKRIMIRFFKKIPSIILGLFIISSFIVPYFTPDIDKKKYPKIYQFRQEHYETYQRVKESNTKVSYEFLRFF
jgi:hypothetical protein